MKIICNSFSLNMITIDDFTLIRAKKVNPSDVPNDVISGIGHADTAVIVSGILGFEVPCNRMNVTLSAEDTLYVAQYRGPRLPEGATKLPEGASLEFLEVTIKPEACKGCPAYDCNGCGNICWAHGYEGY